MNGLPLFTYYDQSAAAKVFAPSDLKCDACGMARGLIYTLSFFTRADEPTLCPDCIANGRAVRTFGGSFNDVGIVWEPYSVRDRMAGTVPAAVLTEIREYTPAYESWQQGEWLFHCSDGAIFRGDATTEDVASASAASREWWEAANDRPWDEEMSGYEPGGAIGVYRFDCRRCGLIMFHWDRG